MTAVGPSADSFRWQPAPSTRASLEREPSPREQGRKITTCRQDRRDSSRYSNDASKPIPPLSG
jgi:hypothetical protein